MTGRDGIQFGLMLDADPTGRRDPGKDAVHAEELGYDIIMVHPDHPSASGVRGSGPTNEMWTMLTWMAARTERIRFAPAVMSLPYRSPSVMAKMAETLDRLSARRLVLAVGAGGDDRAFRAFGLPVLDPGDKVAVLDEAIEVIRGLWSQDVVFFAGRYHRLDGARINPRPSRDIPIWVGAYGARMLRLVGQRADGWLATTNALPLSEAGHALRSIRRAAEKEGRNPDTLAYTYAVRVQVTNDRNDVTAALPNIIKGHPEFIAEKLQKLIDIGFSTLVMWPTGNHGRQRELLADQVISMFRRN